METLSWDSLTTKPANTNLLDGLAVGSLLIFALTFLVIAALALWPRRWGLNRRLGRVRYGRWLSVGAWIASFGLLLLIVRFIELDPLTFGRPIWLLVAITGLLVWLVWLLWMLQTAPPPRSLVAPSSRRPRKGGSYR